MTTQASNTPAVQVQPQDISLTEFETMQKYATAFYKSGLFQDVKSEAQALVKVAAGRELGMTPFIAMRDLSIIQGKIATASAQIAARIQQAGGEWQAIKYDDTACVLRFSRNGKVLSPDIEFNMQHAASMGLASKDNYKKQPRVMLYWRAITMGARMFFPGAFNGPVYTPDELREGVGPELPAPAIDTTQANHHLPVVTEEPEQPQLVIEHASVEPIAEPWRWQLQGTAKMSTSYRGRYLHEFTPRALKLSVDSGTEKFTREDLANIQAALEREHERQTVIGKPQSVNAEAHAADNLNI